ncbi:four-domain proteases inhibitor-like [Mercenaria mercenaria]|uniref:four-domain proteases inhibitor-like n=1 Tax=Mercenaria mercenaria TaxID=6596 RepID=UPI00234EAA45|nr:four-domain proteases inhibitor-like [Mercenaria mercenaria]XP_053391355.1 four-domain proteases inhibitor-like [Mercenaria mercenaria]
MSCLYINGNIVHLFTFLITISTSSCFLFNGSSDLCVYLVNLNCTHHASGTLCGSNKITYANHCEFSKAVCIDTSLSIKKPGPCEHEKVEQDIVLGIACESLLHMNCSTFRGSIKYCGTNGITYANVCHFEQARCIYHNLYLDHFGDCAHSV